MTAPDSKPRLEDLTDEELTPVSGVVSAPAKTIAGGAVKPAQSWRAELPEELEGAS